MRLKQYLEENKKVKIVFGNFDNSMKKSYSIATLDDKLVYGKSTGYTGPGTVRKFKTKEQAAKAAKKDGYIVVEGDKINLLSKKIAKLQKKHGYVSKSMLTQKELEQLKKAGHKISEDTDLNELFFGVATAVGGANAKKPRNMKSDRISRIIQKVSMHPDYPTNDKKALEAVIKADKIDRKTAKYLRKLFK